MPSRVSLSTAGTYNWSLGRNLFEAKDPGILGEGSLEREAGDERSIGAP